MTQAPPPEPPNAPSIRRKDQPQEGVRSRQLTGADPADIGDYVAALCAELSDMTKSARLLLLSYLLSMASQEASRVSRRGAGTK